MTDILDQAGRLEQLSRDIAIRNARSANNETAEYDDDGNRICLECLNIIVKERVKAVDAVRCVDCQSENDKLDRNYL